MRSTRLNIGLMDVGNRKGQPNWTAPFRLGPNAGGLREVVAEGGPEHVVDALGADAGTA